MKNCVELPTVKKIRELIQNKIQVDDSILFIILLFLITFNLICLQVLNYVTLYSNVRTWSDSCSFSLGEEFLEDWKYRQIQEFSLRESSCEDVRCALYVCRCRFLEAPSSSRSLHLLGNTTSAAMAAFLSPLRHWSLYHWYFFLTNIWTAGICTPRFTVPLCEPELILMNKGGCSPSWHRGSPSWRGRSCRWQSRPTLPSPQRTRFHWTFIPGNSLAWRLVCWRVSSRFYCLFCLRYNGKTTTTTHFFKSSHRCLIVTEQWFFSILNRRFYWLSDLTWIFFLCIVGRIIWADWTYFSGFCCRLPSELRELGYRRRNWQGLVFLLLAEHPKEIL